MSASASALEGWSVAILDFRMQISDLRARNPVARMDLASICNQQSEIINDTYSDTPVAGWADRLNAIFTFPGDL